MLKHWTTQIVVAICCQTPNCLQKVEGIVESNHNHKIAKCSECGAEYEMWGGFKKVGGD